MFWQETQLLMLIQLYDAFSDDWVDILNLIFETYKKKLPTKIRALKT